MHNFDQRTAMKVLIQVGHYYLFEEFVGPRQFRPYVRHNFLTYRTIDGVKTAVRVDDRMSIDTEDIPAPTRKQLADAWEEWLRMRIYKDGPPGDR